MQDQHAFAHTSFTCSLACGVRDSMSSACIIIMSGGGDAGGFLICHGECFYLNQYVRVSYKSIDKELGSFKDTSCGVADVALRCPNDRWCCKRGRSGTSEPGGILNCRKVQRGSIKSVIGMGRVRMMQDRFEDEVHSMIQGQISYTTSCAGCNVIGPIAIGCP